MTDNESSGPNLFFDLDGTLADPRDGMTKCLRHALERLGRSVPGPSELLQYIGPSLRWTFPRLLSSDDPELIEAAVCYYRERYSTVGLYEQEVYPGIAALLESLHEDGFTLYVVTSKPQIYAERIIDHFRLAAYFEAVFGPQLNGRFDDKTELVAHVLQACSLTPRRSIMIGDRATDIVAGQANGTRTIAVTYGFGGLDELAPTAPDSICHSPAEIGATLRRGFVSYPE